MVQPVTFGETTYPSKTAFLKAVSNILKTATLYKPLAGDDLEHARMALAYHPKWDEITWPTYKHIVVIEHQGPGHKSSRCFAVTFVGNPHHPSRRAFSYRPGAATVADAARAVVQPDIQAFKDDRFGSNATILCEGCSVNLTAADAQVHHEGMKFREMVEACGLQPDAIETVRKSDQPYAFAKFADDALARDVLELHRAYLAEGTMRLKIVCRACNMAAERKSP